MRPVIAAWVIVSLVACTSMQPVPSGPGGVKFFRPHELPLYVGPGRDVRITTVDGSMHEFRVRTLTNEHVSGESSDGIEHRIEIATIAKLETERFSRSRTIAFGATMAGIFLAVILFWLGL